VQALEKLMNELNIDKMIADRNWLMGEITILLEKE